MKGVYQSVVLAFLVCWAGQAFAQYKIPLKGTVSFDQKEMMVEFPEGDRVPFTVQVKEVSPDEYQLQLTLSHWNTGQIDLSAILEGTLRAKTENQVRLWTGKLASKYGLINNQPLDDLSLNVVVSREKVVIRSFTFGGLSGFGEILLGKDPSVKATLRLSGLSLEEVLRVLRPQEMVDAQGLVDGEIQIQGPLQKPRIQGQVRSNSGHVGTHEYNGAQFKFSGTYPVLQIDESQIFQTDGLSFAVTGMLDLSDLANVQTQIDGLTRTPLVTQKGEGWEWTFKRLQSEDKGKTTEFKYMMRKETDIDRDGGDMLGIEHRMEF